MNAATLAKSAKGLILASSLIAATSVSAFAADVTVPLGTQATLPLSQLYASAPTGTATLGGHSFDLSSGNLIQLSNGQSASFSGSWTNPTSAYLLLNTFNTTLFFDQTVIGNVVVTFSDGTTQSTDLLVGGNVREWRTGATAVVNTITDPNAANVWTGTAQASMGGGTAVLDMLTITLPGTKNVTSITVNDTNAFGAIKIDIAGLTIDPVVPQPPTSGGTGGTTGGQTGNHDDKGDLHSDKHDKSDQHHKAPKSHHDGDREDGASGHGETDD